MQHTYTNHVKTGKVGMIISILFLFTFSFSLNSLAQSVNNTLKGRDCVECFSTEIINTQKTGNCITFTLEVAVGDSCSSALSHMTIAVPCGTISEVWNSEGWKIENPSTDPTTGYSGFKIDDIENFGEDHMAGTFTIEYTVCSDDETCLNQLQERVDIAYKAGLCVSYQEITNTPAFSAALIKEDVSCFGGNNGTIEIETEGGYPPYTYLWSNGAITEDVSGLRAGLYSIIITDATGQTLELSTNILQPAEGIKIEGDVTPTSCSSNTGSIDIAVTGGTAPYTYSWTGNKTTEDIDNLYTGTYLVRVYDALGCPSSASYTVAEDSDLDLTLTPNYLQCHQEGQGEITSVVTGGTEPYSYYWSNQATTPNISGVNSGSYSLTVTDANGCSVTKSTHIGITSLSISTAVVNPTCYGGNDGEISVANVYYGTQPYTYLWSTGDTSQTVSGIPSGRYKVTVTDANGCSVTRTVNLADRQALSLNYSVSKRNCGSSDPIEVNLSGSGGMGSYQYFYDGNEITSPWTVDAEGSYDITMTDAAECSITETISISNTETNININAQVLQPVCGETATGAINLTISGGTEPYALKWNDGSTQQNRTNLLPGAYSVEVIDANGCYSSTSATITEVKTISAAIVTPATDINCETGSNIVLATSEGGNTFNWEISSADNNWYITSSELDKATIQSGTGTAEITYTVMDETGCTATDVVSIGCTTTDSSDNTAEGDDSNDGTDSTDSNNNGDDTNTGDIIYTNCYYTEITSVTATGDDGCYKFKMWVYTDGTCNHELSHLTIGLGSAFVSNTSNSVNWPMESNFTDPQSGLYGLKVDEICGFGQSGEDKFSVEFEACFSNNQLPDEITVVYKSSTQQFYESIKILNETSFEGGIEIKAYPNPFKDYVNFTLVSKKETNGELAIYSATGEKIKTIFNGTFLANIEYKYTYQSNNYSDRLLFFKATTTEGVVQGKLLKVR
ncbi:hypothetical protein [Plebeiibacterium marinum]|uniref:SprB repeat-containing protein n=1 Tax=Plebeiibacterium marinum TaxID=2992111 RepID=A0AAE3MEG8_9BACT|nr:hypothetical protein [Plebeiobacterium marinum]MCW3806115.1 SprB repeat-containing protein [Plebeiobacterium marinum]